MRAKSKNVCARCGVSVGKWSYGWKHQNGGSTPHQTCEKTPMPIERKRYEGMTVREQREFVKWWAESKGKKAKAA